MVATIFLIEYKNYGSRDVGGADDTEGTLAPIPGEILAHHEIDASSAASVTFDTETNYVKIQSFGGDGWFNFDSEDSSGDSLILGNRDRIGDGQILFQSIVNPKTGIKLYSQFNCIDVS